MSNKKAITPIVATVLLLMMTVAAAAGSYLWLTTITSELQSNVAGTVSDVTGKTGRTFSLTVICNASKANSSLADYDSNNIRTVYAIIQNTGSTKLTSGKWVAILTHPTTQDAIESQINETTTEIAAGDMVGLYFQFSKLTDTNLNYIIDITSPIGASGSDTC